MAVREDLLVLAMVEELVAFVKVESRREMVKNNVDVYNRLEGDVLRMVRSDVDIQRLLKESDHIDEIYDKRSLLVYLKKLQDSGCDYLGSSQRSLYS